MLFLPFLLVQMPLPRELAMTASNEMKSVNGNWRLKLQSELQSVASMHVRTACGVSAF